MTLYFTPLELIQTEGRIKKKKKKQRLPYTQYIDHISYPSWKNFRGDVELYIGSVTIDYLKIAQWM